MKWKPLGDHEKHEPNLPVLPGERGRYLLFLGTPFIEDGPRWIHFSWRGDSFCIRDFIMGRMARQDEKSTATAVWCAAIKKKPATGEYYRSVANPDDIEWWTTELKKLEE